MDELKVEETVREATESVLRPKAVTEKIEELNQISEKHPDYIPLEVVAGFLHAKPSGIRSYIDNSESPFGISWQQLGAATRAYKIPTVKFYLWFTDGMGYRFANEMGQK